MKLPYLKVAITPAERESLEAQLKGGWGRVGSVLKGCDDETLVRKMLVVEAEGRARPVMVGNLLGRLRSLERKRILNEILKRRKTL